MALLRVPGEVPKRANHCPVLMHPENLAPALPAETLILATISRPPFIVGFDLISEMLDDDRRRLLSAALRVVAKFIESIETEKDLSLRFQAGDLRAAVIRKDVAS